MPSRARSVRYARRRARRLAAQVQEVTTWMRRTHREERAFLLRHALRRDVVTLQLAQQALAGQG